ncbi:MAG: phosphoribosylpyrophosphate synthetase [Bacteroidetes bacterium]|nr:phosphoribosylpyrophosphate synthetase [Bacteroidota bacterium]
MKNFETISEALAELKLRGYVNDFNLHPEWIECVPMNVKLKPNEFHVDEVYRFEGATDPADSAVIYAINSKHGVKGVLLDAYGTYANSLSGEMIRCLTIDRSTQH